MDFREHVGTRLKMGVQMAVQREDGHGNVRWAYWLCTAV